MRLDTARRILAKPGFRHHSGRAAAGRVLPTARSSSASCGTSGRCSSRRSIAVPLACWSWIVPMARDMYGAMTGPSAWMMTGTWDTPHLLLLGAMWIVMMAGMMLPSAAPILLLYAAAARRRSGDRHAAWRVYAMAAGYLLVWAAFSVCATLLQRTPERTSGAIADDGADESPALWSASDWRGRLSADAAQAGVSRVVQRSARVPDASLARRRLRGPSVLASSTACFAWAAAGR